MTVTIQDDDVAPPPDTEPPALLLPEDIVLEATGPEGADYTFDATATDIDPANPNVTCDPESGSTFAIASTTVNCSETDTNGNTGYGSFNVTVQDATSPDITVPADITEEATSADGAAISFDVSASDIVDSDVTIVCDLASGTTFGIGTTTVNCQTVDDANNSVEGSFTVTITDRSAEVCNSAIASA